MEKWFQTCNDGFLSYDDDKDIHQTYILFLKAIIGNEKLNELKKNKGIRKYLQDNFINLIWCNYYAESFPSLDRKKPENFRTTAFIGKWDAALTFMLKKIHKPKYIFAVGAQLQYRWLDGNKLAPISHDTVINKCGSQKKRRLL